MLLRTKRLLLQLIHANITITKTALGYTIRVVTASGAAYQKLADQYLQIQLAYVPNGEENFAYLNGTLVGKVGNERIYEFYIKTDYVFNSSNQLNINNFVIYNSRDSVIYSDMIQKFKIFYTTTSVPIGFISGTIDSLIGKNILPKNVIGITEEEVTVTFWLCLR